MSVRSRHFGVGAVALWVGICATLAGCGGGGGNEDSTSAPSASAPSNQDPPATNPSPPPSEPPPGEPSDSHPPDEPPALSQPPVSPPTTDPQPDPQPDPEEPAEPAPQPPPGSGPAPINHAPHISGSAPALASAEVAYAFVPQASDADADALSFRVEQLPSWASFDSRSGRLSGTPAAAHAGVYSNIVISVSDGQARTSLPTFSITVTQPSWGSAELSWIAPTQNTDGSVLTNLAGYRIVFGRAPDALSQTVQLSNPGMVRYVVDGLNSGTWYFALKAYTTEGAESALSEVGSKRID